MRLTRKNLAAALLVLAAGGVVTGCSWDKYTEPYNDAPISQHVSNPAEVHAMPDGFSNFAEVCDTHGNRVFVIFHGNHAYGSVFAMKDPTCKTG